MNTPSSLAARKAAADARAQRIAELVRPLMDRGATLREISAWLTAHRVLPPSGRLPWAHQSVADQLRRAGVRRSPRPSHD
jgi:hypothetical protein